MSRWIFIGAALLVALGGAAADAEPGRTDGSEGSEYGAGGYSRYGSGGGLFAEAYFGAAAVDIEDDNTGLDLEQTDLLSGIGVGYMVEDWLAFQVGFGHISEQQTNLFTLGMRSMYNLDPFNYYFSLGAELYAPDQGDEKFGVVPGAGVEMVLSERLHVGLGYQHDFIFADETIGIDRFSARLRLNF
jgi:opacity protein-like surface antigen